ncbi:uncharacterized protein LOC134078039 [Sardina pilchardus]|uniref:uncharacterized protein LOC134078039 n=1 Tax=Sardina pilchardus TaxID=27697 RepID=UPI002E107844
MQHNTGKGCQGRVRVLCLLLPLLLSGSALTSSIRTLDTVEELADISIEFGKAFPRHGLHLLHWLATTAEFIHTDFIQLVNIEPSRGDYGFHRYDNAQGILPSLGTIGTDLPQYFSLGNLDTNTHPRSRQLPSYVTEDSYNSRGDPNWNRDRIVVQISRDNRTSASGDPVAQVQVFITPCHHAGSPPQACVYDGNSTFEVSLQLLGEIPQLTLDAFLRQAGYDAYIRDALHAQSLGCTWRTQRGDSVGGAMGECEAPNVRLEVVTSPHPGYAWISWSGIPRTTLEKGVVMTLRSNTEGSGEVFHRSMDGQWTSGVMATPLRLDTGLQVTLAQLAGPQSGVQLWAGPEFDETNGKLPTRGYDASLQLFVKRGKACVRLYIRKTFSDWMAVGRFGLSWVALYKSSSDRSMSTQTWQWVVRFTRNGGRDTEAYEAYDYESNMDIRLEVQARFFLGRAYSSERARTAPWDVRRQPPQVRLEVQPPPWCGAGLYDGPRPLKKESQL